MLIRPIARADLAALIDLARVAGAGVTTLQPNEDNLARRIDSSIASFADHDAAANARYLFAFEDEGRSRLVGTSGIAAVLGFDEPRYGYRVGTSVSCSREIGVLRQLQTLFLNNDLTGASELEGFYLHPEYRRGGNGSLLSKARFLYMADFSQRFATMVVAGLRGVCNEQGASPFWDSLGRHFFRGTCTRPDYLSGISNRSLIGELMPQHPVYTAFLSKEAQAAIGQAHPGEHPARALLEAEGFHYQGHVDIFDAGPALLCPQLEIHSIRHSLVAEAEHSETLSGPLHLVSNRSGEDFRVIMTHGTVTEGRFALGSEELARLGISSGHSIRVVPLAL